jgi:hypothetical protein
LAVKAELTADPLEKVDTSTVSHHSPPSVTDRRGAAGGRPGRRSSQADGTPAGPDPSGARGTPKTYRRPCLLPKRLYISKILIQVLKQRRVEAVGPLYNFIQPFPIVAELKVVALKMSESEKLQQIVVDLIGNDPGTEVFYMADHFFQQVFMPTIIGEAVFKKLGDSEEYGLPAGIVTFNDGSDHGGGTFGFSDEDNIFFQSCIEFGFKFFQKLNMFFNMRF